MFGPYNIEPILEFMTICSPADAASVAKAGELSVTRDNMSYTDSPWSVPVGQNGSKVFEFELDRRRQRYNCFCFPDKGGHISGDEGVETVVQVFR